MVEKKESRRWIAWSTMFLLVALLALLVFAWSILLDAGFVYHSTAHYRRMEEKYNGFIGMRAEEVVPLVTTGRNYLILEPHTGENGGDWGIFCFPLTNSRSREECFIYGFALDEDHVIVKKYDSFWPPEEFFKMLEWHNAHYPD